MDEFEIDLLQNYEQEDEQGLLICGIYCHICDMKTICLSKEIFKKGAF